MRFKSSDSVFWVDDVMGEDACGEEIWVEMNDD